METSAGGGGSAPWWLGGRSRRGAADRRAQKRRKSGRTIQDVVKDLSALRQHRGCQPTRLGQALLTALTEQPKAPVWALQANEGAKRKTAPGTWFVAPLPGQVPRTRLQNVEKDETDSQVEEESSEEYADAEEGDTHQDEARARSIMWKQLCRDIETGVAFLEVRRRIPSHPTDDTLPRKIDILSRQEETEPVERPLEERDREAVARIREAEKNDPEFAEESELEEEYEDEGSESMMDESPEGKDNMDEGSEGVESEAEEEDRKSEDDENARRGQATASLVPNSRCGGSSSTTSNDVQLVPNSRCGGSSSTTSDVQREKGTSKAMSKEAQGKGANAEYAEVADENFMKWLEEEDKRLYDLATKKYKWNPPQGLLEERYEEYAHIHHCERQLRIVIRAHKQGKQGEHKDWAERHIKMYEMAMESSKTGWRSDIWKAYKEGVFGIHPTEKQIEKEEKKSSKARGGNKSDDEETKDKGETLEEENEFGWKTIRRSVGKEKTKKRSGNEDSVNADKAADDGSPNAKKHEGRNSKEQGKDKGKGKGKAAV